jgi:hypothetical protein
VYIKEKNKVLIAGQGEIMRAIPGRGIYKWDLCCSVHLKKTNPDSRAGRSCAQFPEEEYINGIFIAEYIKNKKIKNHARYLVPRPFMAACAIPRRGIHKWDFCCSVKILIAGLGIMRAIPRKGTHKWDFLLQCTFKKKKNK